MASAVIFAVLTGAALSAFWSAYRVERAAAAIWIAQRTHGPAQEHAVADAEDILNGAPRGAELQSLAAALELAREPADTAAAEAHARAALKAAPARFDAWIRLAYADAIANDRLTFKGAYALKRSYQRTPFSPMAYRRWRVEFAVNNWLILDDELREAVLREASADALTHEGRAWIREMRDRATRAADEALAAGAERPVISGRP